MNAKTPEQKREVVDHLLRLWLEWQEEISGGVSPDGYEVSLSEFFGPRKDGETDTALIERLAGYMQEEVEWTTFDKAALLAEKHPRGEGPWPLEKIIANTYPVNNADKIHIRRLFNEALKEHVKAAQDSEVLKLLKEIAVNTKKPVAVINKTFNGTFRSGDY